MDTNNNKYTKVCLSAFDFCKKKNVNTYTELKLKGESLSGNRMKNLTKALSISTNTKAIDFENCKVIRKDQTESSSDFLYHFTKTANDIPSA